MQWTKADCKGDCKLLDNNIDLVGKLGNGSGLSDCSHVYLTFWSGVVMRHGNIKWESQQSQNKYKNTCLETMCWQNSVEILHKAYCVHQNRLAEVVELLMCPCVFCCLWRIYANVVSWHWYIYTCVYIYSMIFVTGHAICHKKEIFFYLHILKHFNLEAQRYLTHTQSCTSLELLPY